MIWLINKNDRDLEVIIHEEKKFYTFKPNVPIQLNITAQSAIKYTGQYKTLYVCDDYYKYFNLNNKLKQLIIRDAGIGDLLLLEPIIRYFGNSDSRIVDVLTRFPEIYDNHPFINKCFSMISKSNINVDVKQYDSWEDYRSYSETHPKRDQLHRTDIYCDKFNLKLDDKEPRLYFHKDEKCLLKKNKKYTYIGISLDASHIYRAFHKGKELIDTILKKDSKNIVVLFGDKKFIEYNDKRVIDLQCKTTIREAINYIRGIDFFIGVDSGLMHCALTLHIPTVAIFSIITPELRLEYYKGQYKTITADISCIGCGDYHMHKCKYAPNGSFSDFDPKCMNLSIGKIYDALLDLEQKKEINEHIGSKKINIIPHSEYKLTMPIIVQNEEYNLPKFIDNVINHPAIGRVIAIDGGSTDKTVDLLKKAGAEVYHHPYLVQYHDMQAMQRNISCSYVRDGTPIIIMDPDECFSPELSDYLPFLAAQKEFEYGIISRMTFNYYNDINDKRNAIKNYPDYQPRYYIWNSKFKFVRSPHHITMNVPVPKKINFDIFHFEKEGKNRDALENKWAKMWDATRKVYL